MKKNKHINPMSYRIIFRAGNWITKTKRYYNVYHSSEAFDDILHTFRTGKIHSKKITIYKIQEWERFTEKWMDRIDKVIEYVKTIPCSDIVINGKKIVLKGGKK